MQYIDAFNHFMPKRLWDRMNTMTSAGQDIGKRVRGVPCIYDIDVRLRSVENFKDKNYSQVISTSMPPPEALGGPEVATELAILGNDGLAELVQKYPHHFAGFVATLPMNATDAAVKEAERAFTQLGAGGVEIHSNINGAPLDDEQYFPIFEVAAKFDKPVLLHPIRGAEMTD